MDYDNNDLESQNCQLAGEGSTKFPTVLRPYALPKFDFDDSLQGHLRFDNLVETEVFLGIESQEDNRWIEDFSQGSSGIEFTSSAAESCPISRHNNVWSEATSSESVEILLKSVGQEEMIPGQTIIQESDAGGCDQLGSSTKQIEPSLKQDDNILSSVQDVIDSGHTLPPDKFLESLSGENEDSGGLPQVGDISRAHEGESSGHEYSRDLDPDVVGEKCDFPVVEGNQLKDGKLNDANQREDVSLCNEALHNRTLEDFSASKMQNDILAISMQTSGTCIGESNTEEVTNRAIYTSDADEAFMENDHVGEGELHALRKEAQIDDQNTHGCALKSDAYNVEKPLDVAFQMNSVGEQNTVETAVNVKPSSSMIGLGNSDLEMVEGSSASACPVIPAQDSICDVMGLTVDTPIGDHFMENMHKRSPVALEADSNFEVHAVEILNTTSGVGANIELKMQAYVQIKDGQGGMEYLEESGKQINSVISVSKPEESLLFVEGKKLFEGQCEPTNNSVMGDTSSSKVVSSSAELKAHGNKNLEGLPDILRVSGEGLTGEGHGLSSHFAKSEKCEENLVAGQDDVRNSERGYGTVEDEVIVCKAQSDSIAGNRFASDDSLKNADFTSNDTLDGCPISSGNAVTSVEAVDHKDDEKLTSHVGGFTQLDNKEEAASEISVEASLLILNECSQVVSEPGPVSESGNDACCSTAGELNNEAADQSQIVEKCNTASRNESQEAVADKVGKDHSNEQETCLVPCDSTIKENVVAQVALKSREEETAIEILEEASSKVSDADKPTCGSPTVINCAEISKREKEIPRGVKGPLEQIVILTDAITGESKKDCSVSLSQDVKDDVTKDQRGFSFDVSSLADLDKRGAVKSWHQSTTVEASEMTLSVERSPSVSGLGQIDSRKPQKIFHGIPQATNGEIILGGSRGTPERKARRASGRAAGKESAKKRNHVKGTTPLKQLEQVDKSCVVSPGPSLTCQLVQSEGMQHTGHVEQSSKKPANLTTPSSILPDLNTSASLLAVFQQPFTDLQQVQLRAQIFVYGSLIQGTTPEEAWMISAFGGLDGGRNIWENAWRLSVERLRDQKSNSSNPETPLQPLSGARAPDRTNKQGDLQSKMIYSPAGPASSKSAPSPIVNSIIPLSSPLWSISTPSGDVLQSCVIPRSAGMDHNQAPSPLHPYLTPAIRSFVGQTWVSQPPFPCPWVTSPQATGFDSSLHFPTLPITEPVKLTPVRESSGPHASRVKHVSPSPIVRSGGLTSVHPETSMIPDVTNATVSAGQESANFKSKKRKTAPASEDLGNISLPPQIRTSPVSASGVVTSHFSTSVVAATPLSKTTKGKFVPAASTTSTSDQSKTVNMGVEQKVTLSAETLNNVKEAKWQAENAATLAAAAVNHSQLIWDQLDKQKNSGMTADGEAKLASAAVAIAAAASVAKAAAAAAKVAADAALQAKLMAEEAMITSGVGSSGQNNIVSFFNGVNFFSDATPASILKGQGGMDSSGSIIIASREAARRRVDAASAASKQAENLNATVKAAELAVEAVTQAGKVVAMGNPLSLSELVEAGPDGCWRVPQVPSELAVKSNNNKREQYNIESVKHGSESSAQHVEGVTSDHKETRTTSYGKPPASRELSMDDDMRLIDGSSGFVTRGERDLRGQGSKVSDLTKTVGVFPEANIGSGYTSIAVQNEQEKALGTVEGYGIKEGSLVEVFKDVDGSKSAWFLASVSSLKDGEAYVCYTEVPSGSGLLKEWVPLNAEGDKAPRVRIPHPITTMQFEGAKKRRRAAMSNYNWSVGDKVDACIKNCWCEGVVTEKNKKDETTLSVHFPAQGETSIVRAWQLRPSVLWKDGQWVEWSTLRENNPCSHEDDTPKQKRLRLGSPAAESKEKERVSTDIGVVESVVAEETSLLDLCANEKIFNIGKNTRDESKPEASRTLRSGLQKEGPRVIFGVPKPGKKRKFMEVSKHYVADKSIKASGANDPMKLAKVPMPQGSGSGSESRGWRNTKFDVREKQPAESKPKVLKTGKVQSVPTRSIPQKINMLTSVVSAPHDGIMTDHRANLKDSVSLNVNASGKQSRANFGSFPNNERATDGPFLFSSLPVPPDAVSSKKISSSNFKSERASKGRVAPSGGKLAKIQEDKVYNGNAGKSAPDVGEPRRSNRRIQPTSRLLEGLQSSLSISKIPGLSHDRGLKVQNRSASSSRGKK